MIVNFKARNHPRYAVTLPMSERRITCPAGHTFTPDAVLVQGRASVRCRQCKCSELLLVAVYRDFGMRLVVQVTRDELVLLGQTHTRPWVDLLWLVLQPLGGAKFPG